MRLTTSLPDDVWDRLNAEAAAAGLSIGAYLKNLIVARDKRKHPAEAEASADGASPST